MFFKDFSAHKHWGMDYEHGTDGKSIVPCIATELNQRHYKTKNHSFLRKEKENLNRKVKQ